MRKLRIPKRANHPVVDDNLTFLYHLPIVRSFFIKRLTMTLDLLGDRKFENILEIGFGSGVLLHELTKMSKNVFACDIHPHIEAVCRMAEKENLNVHLREGSVLALPYADQYFDCIISVAVLEHIKELALAVSEIKRVLKGGGMAVLGFPVESKLTDFLLMAAGTTRAYRQKLREVHPNSHIDILCEVRKQFGEVKTKRFPNFVPESLSLYYSCLAINL